MLLYFLVKRNISIITSSYKDKTAQDHIYRALIEHSYDFMILSDNDGNHKYTTNNTDNILGYNAEEFRVMKLSQFVHPEDYEEVRAMTKEMKTNPGSLYTVEFRAIHKNESVIWLEARIVNHLDDATINGVITNARNITNRKNGQQALVQLNKELEEKVKERTASLIEALEKEMKLNQMKSRFVSFASHEFRTPLTNILSGVQLIKSYPAADQQDKRLRHINRISAEVSHLTDILNDFLSVEQLESGTFVIEETLFNLPEFLECLVADIDGTLGKKQQTVTYHHDGELMVIQSEKILRNILLNLLSNASKYSADGEDIRLSSSVTDALVTISVTDNGMGIPEEDQQKLFTTYFRAANVSSIQGTGLGLTIVKKYVELLKGKISFASKLNEGTTFTIAFPQLVIESKRPMAKLVYSI